MPTILRLRVQVTQTAYPDPEAATANSWVLRLIERFDPAWSLALHTQNAPRLYSVSPLYRAADAPLFLRDDLPAPVGGERLSPGDIVAVRVALMDDARARAF